MERISAFDRSTLADSHGRRQDAHGRNGGTTLHKLGRRPQKKPTGEHDMLQPVGQGINTQSILAAGCCIVSGMACDNVYRASVNLLAVEFADYL